MQKGEIARYEQFLLFSHCFQNTCRHIKTRACLGKGLKPGVLQPCYKQPSYSVTGFKMLHLAKLEAFTHSNLDVPPMMMSVFGQVEKTNSGKMIN